MKTIKVVYEGIRPILMNSPRSMMMKGDKKVEKMNELMQIRKKTTHEEKMLNELSLYFSMYVDADNYINLNEDVLSANLHEGARVFRNGPALLQSIISIDDIVFRVDDKRINIDKMFSNLTKYSQYIDKSYVNVGRNKSKKIIKYRGIFDNWTVEYVLTYDDLLFDDKKMQNALSNACIKGLLDRRPRYGRFTFKIVK